MPRQFVEKWVLNTRDDSVDREIDTIRSGYPPPSISGLNFYSGVMYMTASDNFTVLLSVPSTKVFRLNRMIVDNDYASPQAVRLYNYGGKSALTFVALAMKVAGSETEFIDDLDVPFRGGASGGVYISTAQPSVWVRIQGVLITSD